MLYADDPPLSVADMHSLYVPSLYVAQVICAAKSIEAGLIGALSLGKCVVK